MSQLCRLAIVSDVHYAGPAEKEHPYRPTEGISNPLTRAVVRAHSHFVWMRDPFAHNHLLDQFIEGAANADYVIANGDFSADAASIGVTDPAACASAAECLDKLRLKFNSRFFATYGDHELGKKKLGCDEGGLRLQSWHQSREALALEPFWHVSLGRYLLVGVVSTLVALPVFENEALPGDWTDWNRLREIHLTKIQQTFSALRPDQRVILFCHDPTALPFLAQLPGVKRNLRQIESTVIGHLHSPTIFRCSRLLAGIPRLNFGHSIRRITSALREARCWKEFNVTFCPSPNGIQLLKDGGYLTAELDPTAARPIRFRFHPLPW